jgi:hypothetical protein
MMTIHSQVRFLDDICGLEQAASACRQTAAGLAPERRHRWHSQLGRLGASDHVRKRGQVREHVLISPLDG